MRGLPRNHSTVLTTDMVCSVLEPFWSVCTATADCDVGVCLEIEARMIATDASTWSTIMRRLIAMRNTAAPGPDFCSWELETIDTETRVQEIVTDISLGHRYEHDAIHGVSSASDSTSDSLPGGGGGGGGASGGTYTETTKMQLAKLHHGSTSWFVSLESSIDHTDIGTQEATGHAYNRHRTTFPLRCPALTNSTINIHFTERFPLCGRIESLITRDVEIEVVLSPPPVDTSPHSVHTVTSILQSLSGFWGWVVRDPNIESHRSLWSNFLQRISVVVPTDEYEYTTARSMVRPLQTRTTMTACTEAYEPTATGCHLLVAATYINMYIVRTIDGTRVYKSDPSSKEMRMVSYSRSVQCDLFVVGYTVDIELAGVIVDGVFVVTYTNTTRDVARHMWNNVYWVYWGYIVRPRNKFPRRGPSLKWSRIIQPSGLSNVHIYVDIVAYIIIDKSYNPRVTTNTCFVRSRQQDSLCVGMHVQKCMVYGPETPKAFSQTYVHTCDSINDSIMVANLECSLSDPNNVQVLCIDTRSRPDMVVAVELMSMNMATGHLGTWNALDTILVLDPILSAEKLLAAMCMTTEYAHTSLVSPEWESMIYYNPDDNIDICIAVSNEESRVDLLHFETSSSDLVESNNGLVTAQLMYYPIDVYSE
jgi:hypothetical protein